ncbi:unnamed protein product [Protopolystoma xenopodis]|uniref:Uncharacterized protein n=1 Tax=Protopolystoma xenopodis TaxID=117903 RepID=A0A448XJW9_9PLAT|nr:unnamed protein product [Protopolystoma xenopodis]
MNLALNLVQQPDTSTSPLPTSCFISPISTSRYHPQCPSAPTTSTATMPFVVPMPTASHALTISGPGHPAIDIASPTMPLVANIPGNTPMLHSDGGESSNLLCLFHVPYSCCFRYYCYLLFDPAVIYSYHKIIICFHTTATYYHH